MTSKLTLWPPLDTSVGGGYGFFKIEVPEFKECFEWHDNEVYQGIWEGTLLITLKEADDRFLDMMLLIADSQTEMWKRVKLRRYAYYCYGTVRVWGVIVRPTFESWKPGDGPLKDKYE